jgi:signal transduction histidine kinase
MKPSSLSSRLTVYWIVGFAVSYFTLPIIVALLLSALRLNEFSDVNLQSWTTKRARFTVESALRRGPDGRLFVEQTEELRAYMEANPQFRFAILDAKNDELLPGSSEDLAAAFAPRGRADMLTISFHLVDDPDPDARGWVRSIDTAVGRVRFILYGANFHKDDVLYNIYYAFTWDKFFVYLPICALMTLIALFVLRRGLAPLRAAAGKAASIDMNSLDQRIPVAGLPSEVAPFVEAMNKALERVDDGVARQKRFLANAAHELRTPITILCSHIANPDDRTFREDIKRDARRIRTIVEQLLSVAHISGQRGATEAATDLGKAALAVILDYMPLAIESGRNIELDCASPPVMARANGWALESVITNLIENAVRAEPVGGTVLVRVWPAATIEIVDHGEGVAPKDREAIFEPFWRKSNSTRGAGLGLAIARELIEQQGGRIWIEETRGGGATFKVSLPRVEQEPVSPPLNDVAAPKLTKPAFIA